MPWFGIGLGYGSTSGFGSLLGGFSAGSGSGLLIAIASLISGLASLGLGAGSGSSSGAVLGGIVGLIALAIFALLIAIPILGVLSAVTGNRAFGLRSDPSQTAAFELERLLGKNRSRAITGLILMVIIFAGVSLVPFLSNILGGGFFVTALAFGVQFLGLLLSKS